MPKRRRNFKRDKARLEQHIKERCELCSTRQRYNVSPLPCCKSSKYVHECCFLKMIKLSFHRNDFRCPYCRQTLIPYNADEPFVPEPSPGKFIFPLYYETYIQEHRPWDDKDFFFYLMEDDVLLPRDLSTPSTDEMPPLEGPYQDMYDLGDIPSPPFLQPSPQGWTNHRERLSRSSENNIL